MAANSKENISEDKKMGKELFIGLIIAIMMVTGKMISRMGKEFIIGTIKKILILIMGNG